MHSHDANAVDAFLHYRRVSCFTVLGLILQPVDERSEGDQSVLLCSARHVSKTHQVCEGLFSRGPIRKAGMRPGQGQQSPYCLGYGPAVPFAMQLPQECEGLNHLGKHLWQIGGQLPEWM